MYSLLRARTALVVASSAATLLAPPCSSAFALGPGDGLFVTATIETDSPSLGGIALRDLDHDGTADLVVADLTVVKVALSDGAGGFSSFSTFDAGPSPVSVAPDSVAIGKLDPDAHADLVVTSAAGVSILWGDGVGGFAPGVVYATQAAAGSVTLADLDDDHDLDIVLQANFAPGAGNLNVLKNHGNGAFGAYTAFTSLPAATLQLADMNGDGTLDAFVTSQEASAVAVLPGTGAGNFLPPQTISVPSPRGSDAGDLDLDGDVDFAVALGADGLQAYRNEGGGTFAPYDVLLQGEGPVAVRVLDADLDGDLDLVTANSVTATLSVAKGDGALGFGEVISFPVVPDGQGSGATPVAVHSGDVDASGSPDLVVRSESTSKLSLFVNSLAAKFVDLGDGKPGVFGTPRLSGSGSLTTGSPTALLLIATSPGAPVLVIASTVAANLPFVGGVLHPFPTLVLNAGSDGAGALVLAFPWPSVPSGTVFYVQDVILDLAATNGVALSNALAIVPP